MKNARKLTCLIVCMVAIFSLASCNKSSPASGGKEKIVFWDLPWGDSTYVAAARALVARYTAETGVEVEYQQIPWDGWVQVYVTAVTSNTGPDVTTGGAFLQHRLALMGEVASLDDLAATYKESDFVNGALNNFKYNGTQIAIPFNADFRGVYYRTDIFEKEGITTLPKNWDEFYTIAKKLTHGNQYGYVSSSTDSSAQWVGFFWTVANGGAYLDNNMNAYIANPQSTVAFDFLRRMFKEGIMPPGTPGYVEADATRLFYQGNAGIMMAPPTIGAQAPADVADKISMMPSFESPSGLKLNVGSVNGIMLLEDSKHKEAGKKFIDWWSKNSISLWSDGAMGPFPARLSLMNDPFFQNDKFKKLFSELVIPNTVLNTYPHPEAHVEMDIMDGEQFYRSVLQELYTTDTPTINVLRSADDRFNKAIEQMRSSAN